MLEYVKKEGKYICKDNILEVFTKLTRRPHFISLQEGNIELGMEIIKILNSNSNSYNHKFEILYNKEDINKAISILIYDSTRFDLIFKYEGFFENEVKIPFDNKGRPYMGGLFKEKYEGEDFDFLINVSSIHRPHGQKLGFLIPQLEETYLKKFNSMFKTSIADKKIFYNVPTFILGDYNTTGDDLKEKKLLAINKNLKTCCIKPGTDNKYNYIFDNILYSNNIKLDNMGTFKDIDNYPHGIILPSNDNGKFKFNKYTSDHLPIAARFTVSYNY